MGNISLEHISDFISELDEYHIDNRVFHIINEINHQINELISCQRKRQSFSKKAEISDVLEMKTLRKMEDTLRDKRQGLIKNIIEKKIGDSKNIFQEKDRLKEVLEEADIGPISDEALKRINQEYISRKVIPTLIKNLRTEALILCEFNLIHKEHMLFGPKEQYPWLSVSQMHKLNNIINSSPIKEAYIDQIFEVIAKESISKIKDAETYELGDYLIMITDTIEEYIKVDQIFENYYILVKSKVAKQLAERDQRRQKDRVSPKKKEEIHIPIATSSIEKIVPIDFVEKNAVNSCITDFVNTFCPNCPSKELVNDALQRVFRNKGFLYIDDLETRIQQPLNQAMRDFLIAGKIELKDKTQKTQENSDPIVVTKTIQEEIIEDPILIRFKKIEAENTKIESRIEEYVKMFIEFGYTFENEKRFSQSLTDLSKSQSQIEGAIKNLLKYIAHGRKEEKKTGRDYYMFKLTDSYRIFLHQKGIIDDIGSHSEYEKKLKNTFK